jgi:hypothetical protein
MLLTALATNADWLGKLFLATHRAPRNWMPPSNIYSSSNRVILRPEENRARRSIRSIPGFEEYVDHRKVAFGCCAIIASNPQL